MTESKNLEKRLKLVIVSLSIIIPLVVGGLFSVKIEGYDLSVLPHIYAPINGITALVLIMAVMAVKKGQIEKHKKLMKTAMVLSACFLLLYVFYHMTSEATLYGDVDGNGKVSEEEALAYQTSRLIYVFLLIGHIILSVTVIPLVLFSYLRAYLGKIDEHKKLVKYTFPIWLFVAVSGVVVYLMISPFYH